MNLKRGDDLRKYCDWEGYMADYAIKAVVFDWGGVLIENPGPGLMQGCADRFAVTVDRYIEVHKNHAFLVQNGQITDSQYFARIAEDLGVSLPDQAENIWQDTFAAVYKPMRPIFDYCQLLQKKGFKTAILSNTEKSAIRHFFAQGYTCFDVQVFSCDEGVSKPDSQIYQRTIQLIGLPANACLFVDDRPYFIEGAKKCGMQTIHFQSVEQFFTACREFELPLLP